MTEPPNCLHVEKPRTHRLFIFGAGGFGREVAWLAGQTWGDSIELAFLVDRPEYLVGPVDDIPVRLISDIKMTSSDGFVVAIGDPGARRRSVAACEARGLNACTLIHSRVEASRRVQTSPGNVICAGAILTTNVTLGVHVHINLGCTIGHDVQIGDYVTLSPGVHVSGNVTIGSDVFIGTGANIINGHPGAPLVIGDGAVIAAGACVTRSVEAGALMAGVPAVRKR